MRYMQWIMISYPVEARNTIELIIKGGPFPYRKDGTKFDDKFGDLVSRGEYLEITVPTPGVNGRGGTKNRRSKKWDIVFYGMPL